MISSNVKNVANGSRAGEFSDPLSGMVNSSRLMSVRQTVPHEPKMLT